MDWNLMWVAVLAGFIPFSFLFGMCLVVFGYFMLRQPRYEVEYLPAISAADVGKIALAYSKHGYDVIQLYDEGVRISHLIVRRKIGLFA